ncbi:polysaccharide lyase family 7 protein [Flavobacterium algicola]|uniref:polysaccharide lyase family 7 protein n=1 Tax=Flavobacterium algicola TaxID=556529 RepID=UPI001EFCC573|nr:polysaccharide lyase family 7 protein [Flavobacterium algicola]MCG9792429.1 polysaccharide lyase family 7 protein [Flavobacterium algicola]
MTTNKKFSKLVSGVACLTLAIAAISCTSDDANSTTSGEVAAVEATAIANVSTAKVTSSNVTSNYKIQIGTTSGSTSTTSYTSLTSSGVSTYCYLSGDNLMMTMNKGKSTRCELRGLSEYSYNASAYQQTKLYVTKYLSGGEMAIVQLHRNGDNDQQFFMLVVDSGKFRFKQNSHKTDTGNTETKTYIDSDVAFNTGHEYKITLQMASGKLNFSIYDATDKTHYTKSFTISSTNFGASGYYFKTGVYNQTTGTGEVKVTSVTTGSGTAPLTAY